MVTGSSGIMVLLCKWELIVQMPKVAFQQYLRQKRIPEKSDGVVRARSYSKKQSAYSPKREVFIILLYSSDDVNDLFLKISPSNN